MHLLEKEVADEIIFRTIHIRNRIILELLARAGMRISEALKLTPNDNDGSKLTFRNPRSGRKIEFVYISQGLSNRLQEYIQLQKIALQERLFPITYGGAREVVRMAGTQ